MKLHALRLRNVKGIADRQVQFPDIGIVVIEGANEIGKTSMIEALDLLIDEKDSSRKRQVLAVRPVGRDVPTVIEAEMSSGPYRFVYRKQWFRQPSTELTVLRPRQEQLTGVQAHERVLSILAETADLRLWKSLRLMQATPLGQAELSGSSALAAALDNAAGRVDTAGADGDSLVCAAEAAYLKYYTRGRGEPTGEFRSVSEAVRAAVGDAGRALSALEEVAADVERHARVVDELTHCETDLIAAEAEFEALTRDWAHAGALAESAGRARSALHVAAREHDLAIEGHRERTRLAEELTALEEGVRQAAETVAALTPQLDTESAGIADLAARRDGAVAALERHRLARELADADVVHLRDAADLRSLRLRCAAVDAAITGCDTAAAALAPLTVDKAALARIEKAHSALAVARAALEAGSASVDVLGLAPGASIIVDGETVDVDEERPWGRLLSDPIEVVVPGVARIRLTPQAGLEDRAVLVESARAGLARALAAAGVPDVATARARHDERQAAAAAMSDAATRLDALLSGDRVDVLRDRLAALEARVATFARHRQLARPAPESAEEAGRLAREARTLHESQAREAEVLGAALQSRRDAAAALRLELATVQSLQVSLEARRVADAARLAGLRDRASDDALLVAVATSAQARDEARGALDRVEAELAACDPEGIRLRLAARETSLPGLRARRTGLRDERVGIEARLEQASGQGRREQLDLAQVRVQRAEREHQSVARRALAAKTLHDTLQRHRAEANRAYVEPFADAVRRFGKVVYRPDFDVEVADDLTIGARVLDGVRIDFDALSTGAREQLAILSRLAAASLVDVENGVPVVIDDALGYSDPERLARVCAALSLVGPDAQLLLLSCTPGRYAGVGEATVIRL